MFLGQRKEKTGQYFLQALLETIIMRPLFDYNRKCSSHYLVNILNACGLPYGTGCMISPVLEMRTLKLKEVNLSFIPKVTCSRARPFSAYTN